jgi:hypothetical protein
MASATRVVCNKEGNSNGGKSNGNEGDKRAMATRAIETAKETMWAMAIGTRLAGNKEGKGKGRGGKGNVGGSTNKGGSAGGNMASDVAAGSNVATLAAGSDVVSVVAAGRNVMTSKRVPFKMIGGRAWSPGVYQALQTLGNPLDAVRKRAFVSHFYLVTSIYYDTRALQLPLPEQGSGISCCINTIK